MVDSTKNSDEKFSFEDVGIRTTGRTTSTSAANVTRFISEKLLYWGVEERGAYHTVSSNFPEVDSDSGNNEYFDLSCQLDNQII
jgi:hypothetical protein